MIAFVPVLVMDACICVCLLTVDPITAHIPPPTPLATAAWFVIEIAAVMLERLLPPVNKAFRSLTVGMFSLLFHVLPTTPS